MGGKRVNTHSQPLSAVTVHAMINRRPLLALQKDDTSGLHWTPPADQHIGKSGHGGVLFAILLV